MRALGPLGPADVGTLTLIWLVAGLASYAVSLTLGAVGILREITLTVLLAQHWPLATGLAACSRRAEFRPSARFTPQRPVSPRMIRPPAMGISSRAPRRRTANRASAVPATADATRSAVPTFTPSSVVDGIRMIQRRAHTTRAAVRALTR